MVKLGLCTDGGGRDVFVFVYLCVYACVFVWVFVLGECRGLYCRHADTGEETGKREDGHV